MATTEKEKIQNEIDNYTATIRGMIIFMNVYRFDDKSKQMKPEVRMMQGWKFQNKKIKVGEAGHEVTPDFSVLDENKSGVIGEVKISFSMNKDNWKKDLIQLKNYDAELSRWPHDPDTLKAHDIVLLLTPDFSRKVIKYYEENIVEIGKFSNPFIIVEFNEEEKRKRFFRYRIEYGNLSNTDLNTRLQDGVPVPEDAFIQNYAEVKLWDSKPHPLYLIGLIWQHVVFDRASTHEKFQKLRKGSKLPVTITISEVVELLEKFFTIKKYWLGQAHHLPQLPRRAWVVDACEKIVEMKEGRWLDKNKENIEIDFKRHDDQKEYFLEKYLELQTNENQPELFPQSSSVE